MIVVFSCMPANAVPRIKVVEGTCDSAKAVVDVIIIEQKAVRSRLKTGMENMPLNTVLDAQLNGMQQLLDRVNNWAKYNCPSV